MQLRFNEAKATQAASRLLRLRGGTMSYLKLIKLLYLADREALLRWGRPITTDRYVSMGHGPVVKRIYDLIVEEPLPGSEPIWRNHISEPQSYEISLLDDPGSDELSLAEEALLDEIFNQHRDKGRWDLVKYTHTLPEWRDPEQGSARITDISVRDILKAGNKSDDEIAAIENG